MDLYVDHKRKSQFDVGSISKSDIVVKAVLDGDYVEVDVKILTRDSFLNWIRSEGNGPRWREQVLLRIFEYEVDEDKPEPQALKLRVYWISNPPVGKMEYYNAKDLDEAKVILAVLAKHDLNLGDSLVSSNASGIEVFEDGEWAEYNEDFSDSEVFLRITT